MRKFIEITNKNKASNVKISEGITQSELDRRLKDEELAGFLKGGEHWFRNEYFWYRLNIGYTNPLNFGEVHAELDLIKRNIRSKNPLFSQTIEKRHQIFYGIGVGDTEILFADWAAKTGQRNVFITGIDVNKEFLQNFLISLSNRTFEPDEPTFFFKPLNNLFDQISTEDLQVEGLFNTHFCLGGTIGNFKDQDRLFQVFSRLCSPGDLLVLGFQQETNLSWIFEKYRNNPLFSDFILNYIPDRDRTRIEWALDEKTGVITARHNNIEIFRTTKYNSMKLKEKVTCQGFEFIYEDVDEYGNSCIHVYKRNNSVSI